MARLPNWQAVGIKLEAKQLVLLHALVTPEQVIVGLRNGPMANAHKFTGEMCTILPCWKA